MDTSKYNLELETPDTLKLLESTIKLIEERKNEKNVPSPDVIEEVSVQCILVDNAFVLYNIYNIIYFYIQ